MRCVRHCTSTIGVCCRVDTGFDEVLARAAAEDRWALQRKWCTGGISHCRSNVSDWRGCCNPPVELHDASRAAHVWWGSDWQAWVPKLADWAAGEGEGGWWHCVEAHPRSSFASECQSPVITVQYLRLKERKIMMCIPQVRGQPHGFFFIHHDPLSWVIMLPSCVWPYQSIFSSLFLWFIVHELLLLRFSCTGAGWFRFTCSSGYYMFLPVCFFDSGSFPSLIVLVVWQDGVRLVISLLQQFPVVLFWAKTLQKNGPFK